MTICTLRLLGAPVFLPLGLQTGSVIWLLLEIIWIIADDATYEWSSKITLKHKMIDGTDHLWLWLTSRLRTKWSTSHTGLCGSPPITFLLSTTHTQTTNVISHHIFAFCACRRNCLELVTCPVKTCSSDQTVTPLIRVWSDWKALEGQISYSGSND